jgi:hypothetical protein
MTGQTPSRLARVACGLALGWWLATLGPDAMARVEKPSKSADAAAAPAGGGIYRCPDGQYRDAPCPGGRPLAIDPPPSAEQRKQAQDAAARQSSMADGMRDERLAKERLAARQGPIRIGPDPASGAKARPKAGAKPAGGPEGEPKRKRKNRAKNSAASKQEADERIPTPGQRTRPVGPTRLDHQVEKREAIGPSGRP